MRKNLKFLEFFGEPVYINSLYLILNSGLTTFLGAIFIPIITRLYTTNDIGYFSAIISSAGLIATLSRLGFDIGIIRFLPESRNPNNLINSCLIITGGMAFSLSIIFILFIKFFIPSVQFIQARYEYIFLFLLLAVLTTINNVQLNIFISRRATRLLVIQNAINNVLRLLIVIFISKMGLLGILSAHTIGLVLSLYISLYIFIKKVVPTYALRFSFDPVSTREIYNYSIVNHIGSLLGTSPSLILPLMVVSILGPESAAQFYVVWSIVQITFVISGAISTSYFAEASNDPTKINSYIYKCLKIEWIIYTLIIISFIFIGKYILLLFGAIYQQNTYLLCIFAFSAIPLSYKEIFTNVKKVQNDIKSVLLYNVGFFSATLALSYLLLVNIGIIGIGYGFLLAQILVMLFIMLRENGFKRLLECA